MRMMPGLEVVGRGILLRPYQPYQLAKLLFTRHSDRVITSNETGDSYHLPQGYEVNDSPPMPMNEALNQLLIEESWERFETHIAMDASVAAGSGSFSVSATASANNRLRAEQEAYYAVRSSFVPLWMTYIPDPSACIEAVLDPDLPEEFSTADRRVYDEFFRTYGSHYVRGAWVGGKSMLVFTVLKSAQIDKSEIQAGLKASLGSATASVDVKQQRSKEKLLSSSQCTVIGKGGDEVLLAEMSSLDQAAYNSWLKTIPKNPQVIELDVAGIWTLVRNPKKAAALQQAYREAVTFDPIRAVFDLQSHLFFIRGGSFITYDRKEKQTSDSRSLVEAFPELERIGFERIDDSFRGRTLHDADGESLEDKLYVFRQDRVLRLDLKTRATDEGYPRSIHEEFPGMPFPRIDAGLVTGFDSLYFFYGNQYARYNPVKGCFDEGYPQPIAKRWAGVTFDRLDAAVYWGNGKVYFFRGDQHIRYDLANYRSDPGYPKYVIGNYVSDWQFIE